MDEGRFGEYYGQYKKIFASYGWKEAKHKWQAVKNFHDRWDPFAYDYAGMLASALEGTESLFGIQKDFAGFTLPDMAHTAADDVRAMFDGLFDESRELYRRIRDFITYTDVINNKNGVRRRMRVESPYALSVLLSLRYPDKYYLYNFGNIKWLYAHLNNAGNEIPDINDDFWHILSYANSMYDEVREELGADTGFIETYRSKLDSTCWDDPGLFLLTSDICSYIASNFLESESQEEIRWMPAGYDPEITTDVWKELLADPDIFDEDSYALMARMKDFDEAASCNDLAANYGKTKHYYNTQSTALAKRIIEKTNCAVPGIGDSFARLCSIMYTWRISREFDDVNMLWKLRPELSDALEETDLGNVELYSDVAPRSRIKNYWLLNTNPKVWGFSHAAVGEVKAFSLYNDNGYKRRIFDNFLNAKEGDKVIGYESYPSNQIVGLGRISAAHDDKFIYFEKTEGLASPIDLVVLKNNPELGSMEFFKNMQGSLFRVNQGEYDRIMDIIREENPLRDTAAIPKYTREDFLDEVYMTGERYEELTGVLKAKKNVILQGAPGVGKTFTARRLAYSIMGEKDDSRIEFVQFHQNFTYEDFMLGYRPTESGTELKYGIFYRFCLLAGNEPDKDYFFIIDEINRGNMSRIFGELLMMIETDYRGVRTTLSYNGLSFMVPKNLYIIGMMNTADRSLALIDYALRRRFGFCEIGPRFDSEGFTKYRRSLANPAFDRLIDRVMDLNREIEADPALGRGYCIGHSYFCNRTAENCTTEWMNSVIDYDIVPTLREYWYNAPDKVARWEKTLKGE